MLSNETDQKNRKFTFADLFAGIGGMRLAFENLGGSCHLTSEIDESALETYKLNFKEPENHIYISDVHQIKLKSLKNQNIDILLAGFPCQPYSIAGLRKGLKDDRGGLIFKSLLRILSEIKPRVFLLENVKGIASHDNGKTFKYMLEQLSSSGYHLKYESLNTATHSNIPQNRERIFIVGWLKEINRNFKFPLGKDKDGGTIFEVEHLNQVKATKVKDILIEDPEPKYTISDKLYAGHLRRRKEHKEKGNGFGFSLFNENSAYTSTISARYYKDGSEILIEQKDANPRKLTTREAANLQGYDQRFIIPVSDVQAYKQFGNSVSVPVIQTIFHEIQKQLLC